MPRSCDIWTDAAVIGSGYGPAGAGVVLQLGSKQFTHKKPLGVCSTNEAEYAALHEGLTRASEAGAEEVTVYTDSQLVERQLRGRYRVHSPRLRARYEAVKALMDTFKRVRVRWIRRERNRLADRLASSAAREALEASELRIASQWECPAL